MFSIRILWPGLAIILVSLQLHGIGQIHEISSMSEIEAFVQEDDLVLFDLDHTIFEGAEPYGHANWFYDRISDGRQHGIHAHETIRRIFPEWLASQRVAKVVPVEPITPALIRRLQDRGNQVMALTARQIQLVDPTLKQVASLDIDFKRTAPPFEEVSILFEAPAAFHDGILFTSEFNEKGYVLKTFPKKHEFAFKRILVIDDIKQHLINLQATFEPGIEVIGFHYPLVDSRRDTWDSEAAKQEYERRKPTVGDDL